MASKAFTHRLDEDLVAQVDAVAQRLGITSRTQYIEAALQAAIDVDLLVLDGESPAPAVVEDDWTPERIERKRRAEENLRVAKAAAYRRLGWIIEDSATMRERMGIQPNVPKDKPAA